MRARPRNFLWWAAMVHRLSGLALAVFLPLHFLALGLALQGDAALDGFLAWSDRPAVKAAEMGLVALLSVHMLGGLRLLVLEHLGWSGRQATLAAGAGLGSVLVAFAFLFRVV